MLFKPLGAENAHFHKEEFQVIAGHDLTGRKFNL